MSSQVPLRRDGAENWEAGRNPALPPQRWWSEVATGDHWAFGLGRCRDRPQGQLQSPETSQGHFELD